MKKLIILLTILAITNLFSPIISLSQNHTELWGVKSNGGYSWGGVIFKTDGNGENQQVMHFFGQNPGAYPAYSHLCQANNGKLYGLTKWSGYFNSKGVLFEYDPVTSRYTKKYSFDDFMNGVDPYGSLVQAGNGKLYGMAYDGGANSFGVLFEYDPATSIYTKKFDFNGIVNGCYPQGSLIQGPGGKLYGMTSKGGANNMGVLFEYDPATSTYTKKLDFNGTANGCFPNGSLTFGSSGKLYGMTYKGGANNMGVLFEYDPITSIYVKKLEFNGANNGNSPYGSLIQVSNGNLYGMTSLGGVNSKGVLFEYNPITSIYVKKLDFNGAINGSLPYGSLMKSSNGKLYGMTSAGGTNDFGVLFEYDPNNSNYIIKFNFDGTNGKTPNGSLMQAVDGKLYGMTHDGGVSNCGVLFEYDPTTSLYTKKISFDDQSNGHFPLGSLMQATNGKLYGIARSGGNNNAGVLFEYDPITSTFVKKFDFGLTDGYDYYGSLIQASNGKLYGMTRAGGANYKGVLFEYDPITSIYTKKLDFNGAANGSTPEGTLLKASNGKLYGMTIIGGTNDFGVLFEYDPITSIYTKKLDFNGAANGSTPEISSLMQASNGKIYGTTKIGGTSNCGVLFEYDLVTNVLTKKYDFSYDTNGYYPIGKLIQADNGKLYGVTASGINNYGVIFEYDLTSSVYTKKYAFDIFINGAASGSLIQASNRKLYGLAANGPNNYGVLYEYDLTTSTYTKKLDFVMETGIDPSYTNLVEICANPVFTASIPDDTICIGNIATYITSVHGNGLTFQWQLDTGSGFSDISDNVIYSGAQNDTLNIIGALSMSGYEYRCIVTSVCPIMSIISDTALLVVKPAYCFTETNKICEGDTYHWQGSDYTTTNTFTASYTSNSGYDSTYKLNLIVNPRYAFFEADTVCKQQIYQWHGQILSTDGVYYDNHTSVEGCDSNYTLNLITTNSYAYTESQTICNGQTYLWRGQNLFTTGVYQDNHSTIDGCDSSYSLMLTINPSYAFTETKAICEGQTYTWHGQTLLSFGTYHDNLTTIKGCDSTYTLILSVNNPTSRNITENACDSYTAPDGVIYTTSGVKTAVIPNSGGCDSIITINLTINPIKTSISNISVCPSSVPFMWNGLIFSAEGSQTATLVSSTGCDSLATLDLSIKQSTANTITETVCDSYTAPDGVIYTTSGVKTAVIPNSGGCDSIITINLTINPIKTSISNISVCPSSVPFMWNGLIFSAEGSQTATLVSSTGCDSLATLNLSIKQSTANTITETVCDSYTAPDGVNYTTSGVKTAVIPNSGGCDSIITINLTINPTKTSISNISVCPSSVPFMWNGLIFSAEGSQTATLVSSTGCDSLATLDLSIKQNTANTITETVCDSYTAPDGVIYTTSGVKTAVIPNSGGCDSIITINLTINTVDASVTHNLFNLIANASPATYQWLDCNIDYAPISGETFQSFMLTTNGNYAVIVMQGTCSDTSDCVQINTVGICDESMKGLKIYPNPVSSELIIEMAGKSELQNFEILNSMGQVVFKGDFVGKTIVQTANFAPGVYLVKLMNGERFMLKKIIKE